MLRSAIKTTILLGALTGLLILIGGIFGGRSGMEVAFVIALLMNFFSYWFSGKMVLKAYGAQELDAAAAPELYSIVQELAQEAHIPVPRMYLIDTDTPNAFATGRSPHHAAVAVTRGILRICSRDELKGVLGHELSHVINRDILTSSIAATLAGAIMILASMARWGAIFGGFGGGGGNDDRRGGMVELLLMAFLAPLAATMIQLAVSRTREYQADASGAHLTHHPLYLASALRKLEAANERMPMDAGPATAHLFIVNPLTAQQGLMSRLFSTHPPLEERIRRLEHMANTEVV
jgi:heat shock protein HtpX